MDDIRQIPLTQGKVAVVDASDYDFLMQWNWYAQFDKKKQRWTARTSQKESNKKLLMHRVILSAPKGVMVDHRDGDSLNNRRSTNLRLVTNQQNTCNRGPQRNNKSGYKGVSWVPRARKWMGRIRINNRVIHLGYFADKLEAAKAYAEAAKKYHGDFARTHGDFARTEPFNRGEAA